MGLCSSEPLGEHDALQRGQALAAVLLRPRGTDPAAAVELARPLLVERGPLLRRHLEALVEPAVRQVLLEPGADLHAELFGLGRVAQIHPRMLTDNPAGGRVKSEEHTSELQSLMRISS